MPTIDKNTIFFILLLFFPVSVAAQFWEWGATVVFITAGLAIVPLASFLGTATEKIAVVVGPNLGGLLNATFGNATELILALFALRSGLIEVVKATITGSILSNLLLVMGFSMLLGGLRYKQQQFQSTAARMNASTMNLAVIAILLPTAVEYTSTGIGEITLQRLSVAVAVVLILVYGLTLLFSMKTHDYLYDVGVADSDSDTTDKSEATEGKGEQKPNVGLWVGILLAVTVVIAIESELLVNSLEEATSQLKLTALFTGVILLPIIGNAAEHITAVTVAIKDKMDLSMSIAVGSSMQIALFVAPVLVIAGWFLDQPMDLDFNPFELVAVAVSVLITNSISSDGKSNWLEGSLLLATYTIVGLAFYFHPVVPGLG
ncbi:MAG: calcium/proton exchanger [Cyanobacteria bacterium QS_7_48_42]|jgi:Ca2+:H+ antiporter|nr:MAG: calcium/proton exchanger [Cyanobacteria bacterium QH_1_48_107]PSO53324.1 MAG: calcium/proton exchanger [Cyanobacteria bacterium QH_10_48_56]PSO59149.1 MAG: calcium/proton exchanger [Cyanobacteria bacterium QH_7_48_89]PSO63416.1 MAG: calcium/proton exchanger [Cyanobacteria bacterium QH_2_48_84]PSO67050.1 MAG: calcium/proton exchanger [Cyanobacteria bacterium QH_6_48_35]PSO70933.1 MAG: calcium/proton exchanger [Cyanobacteria bacterium QS_1_48_34]PSO75760.1 MAG: calcium/proton exchanger 